MTRTLFLFIAFCLAATTSFAQVREIPKAVKDSFAARYSSVENVKYTDNLVSVHIAFIQNGEKFIAKFSNNGAWKETEKEWSFDQLGDEVKDGFWKSKYADWPIKETAIVYLPNGGERYRVKVEQNELYKKYLFFNKNGRLVRDAVTL
jgi:hypothetical protein